MHRFVFLLLLSVGIVHAHTLEVRAEPEADIKQVRVVKNVVDAYNNVLKEEFGLSLKKEAVILVCSNEESYSKRLRSRGNPYPDRTAKSTGGISYPGDHLVLIKLTPTLQLKKIIQVTTHELTHVLQAELADESSTYLPWMHEGMADYVAAITAQKMGAQSFEQWKLESLNALRRAKAYPSPQDISDLTPAGWNKLTAEMEGSNYRVADLMLDYLFEKDGPKLFDELAEYYRCLGSILTSEKTCFSKNFGIEPKLFYSQVQTWVSDILASNGNLEIVPHEQDGLVSEISGTYTAAKILLEEKIGQKMNATLRLHLSKNSEEMADQLMTELGLTKEIATKQTKLSAKYSRGNVAFINTGSADTPSKRTYWTGRVVVEQYLLSQASAGGNAYWIHAGLTEWLLAQFQEKLGLHTPAQTATLRKNVLDHAENGLPALAEMSTVTDFNKAMSKYGAAVIRALAAEAVESLVNKKGITSMQQWIAINKQHKDSADAFDQAFGETLDTFTQNFKIGEKPL